MADVPVGAVPAPAAPTPTAKPSPGAARAAKLASVNAGLAKLASETAPSATATQSEVPPASPDAIAQSPAPIEKPPVEKTEPEPKVEAKPEEKVDEAKKADDDLDPKTAKAIARIDAQAKKFREEQAADRKALAAEREQHRAEMARERAEMQAKYTPVDELQKLAEKDPLAALRKLRPNMTEDDWEVVGRGAFPFTKAGKADPNASKVAAQTQREREMLERLERAEKAAAEMREMMETRDKKVAAQQYVENWQAEAVKAIPAEPTLIGKLHAKSPAKAKAELLRIGAELERENQETPSYADVIEAYEKQRRAELEEQGVDVDALLKPSTIKAPEPKPAPSKTLDLNAPSTGTRPINGHASRADKLAMVSQGLKKLEAETA